ncbi:MAG: hypothetical protein OHK0019_05910 [Saprospiraceae bacterium]
MDTIIEDVGTVKSVCFIDNFTVGTLNRPDELVGVDLAFSGANPVSDELSLKIIAELP